MPQSKMLPPINYVSHKEFSVRIEDLSLQLLIDEPFHSDQAENKNLYHILHDHATSELFVCAKGEIYIQFQSGIIKLSAGEAAIVPKGMLHTKCPDAADSIWHAISFICARLPIETSCELYKSISPIVDCEKVIIFKNAESLIHKTEQVLELSECGANRILPAMRMAELLLECSRAEHELFEGSSKDADNPEGNSDIQRIAKLDQLVYTNYMRDMTADDIAAELFISVRQLDRIARKRYGKPIHRVIMGRRITAAENMLLSTVMTADSIGSAVGFGSRSGFYREFERKHGMTPTEYRKKNK